jgi:hypothetical protein
MPNENHNARNRSLNNGAGHVARKQTVLNGGAPANADPVFDDDRIDWERKQKGRRVERDETPEDVIIAEDEIDEVLKPPKAQPSSGVGRKKKRQLVYDEEADRIVVRRKRKRQRDFLDDEW